MTLSFCYGEKGVDQRKGNKKNGEEVDVFVLEIREYCGYDKANRHNPQMV